MSPKSLILVIVLGFSLIEPAFALEKYVVDPDHSNVVFTVRHLIIAKVQGEFTDFSGSIMYDQTDPSHWDISGSIQVSSIDTNQAKRDAHLRGPDFFDVAKYPEITFKSKNIVKKDDSYLATGLFTMHGVTKEIQVPFRISGTIVDPWGNKRMALEAELTLDRLEYGVNFNQALEAGGLLVSNEVDIHLSIELVLAKE
ncbi:YceI family protein [bacterium]|nr:YceI family protein [bacterium]